MRSQIRFIQTETCDTRFHWCYHSQRSFLAKFVSKGSKWCIFWKYVFHLTKGSLDIKVRVWMSKLGGVLFSAICPIKIRVCYLFSFIQPKNSSSIYFIWSESTYFKRKNIVFSHNQHSRQGGSTIADNSSDPLWSRLPIYFICHICHLRIAVRPSQHAFFVIANFHRSTYPFRVGQFSKLEEDRVRQKEAQQLQWTHEEMAEDRSQKHDRRGMRAISKSKNFWWIITK